MENLQYLYHLHTWGGFYNDEYQKKHGFLEGHHYFDSAEDRYVHLKDLQQLEMDLNARHLVFTKSEGFNTKVSTVLHRVTEWEGKQYYTTDNLGPDYPYDSAQYMLEWRWYPGFNDYPLGEDFDYETNRITTIQEWITGAFTISQED